MVMTSVLFQRILLLFKNLTWGFFNDGVMTCLDLIEEVYDIEVDLDFGLDDGQQTYITN